MATAEILNNSDLFAAKKVWLLEMRDNAGDAHPGDGFSEPSTDQVSVNGF